VGSKVRSFGQWAAATCAAPPSVIAGQYTTLHCKPLLDCWSCSCKWRYINVARGQYYWLLGALLGIILTLIRAVGATTILMPALWQLLVDDGSRGGGDSWGGKQRRINSYTCTTVLINGNGKSSLVI